METKIEEMKILLAHNFYGQPGGEDTVFNAEKALLREKGHEILEYTADNKTIKTGSQLSVALQCVWSAPSYSRMLPLIREFKPDVVHFHNTFPLISPSAYYACKKASVPVVQTLHNYRLLCPNAMFYRNGGVCEDCLGKLPWRGVLHACYRKSTMASAAVATMLAVHRLLKTWQKKVDAYITLTEFAREKFIEGGLPAEKIHVKPNFVHSDPGTRENGGSYALYVGRLSPEKGVKVMLDAWERTEGVPLRIVGDGPLRDEVSRVAGKRGAGGIEVLGRLSKDAVIEQMKGASFLVFPSLWYEMFGMVVAEAYACGVPVIAPKLGPMEAIVEDGVTGLHFSAGDAGSLAAVVRYAWENSDKIRRMDGNARKTFEEKYSGKRNYALLAGIYENVINSR